MIRSSLLKLINGILHIRLFTKSDCLILVSCMYTVQLYLAATCIVDRDPYSLSSGRPRQLKSHTDDQLKITPKVVLWTSKLFLNYMYMYNILESKLTRPTPVIKTHKTSANLVRVTQVLPGQFYHQAYMYNVLYLPS